MLNTFALTLKYYYKAKVNIIVILILELKFRDRHITCGFLLFPSYQQVVLCVVVLYNILYITKLKCHEQEISVSF